MRVWRGRQRGTAGPLQLHHFKFHGGVLLNYVFCLCTVKLFIVNHLCWRREWMGTGVKFNYQQSDEVQSHLCHFHPTSLVKIWSVLTSWFSRRLLLLLLWRTSTDNYPQHCSWAHFNSIHKLEGAARSMLFVLLCVCEMLRGCESTGAAHVVCDDGGGTVGKCSPSQIDQRSWLRSRVVCGWL